MRAGDLYKAQLKRALSERCRQNPRYSLRAFARDLSIAPSHLSRILNGSKNLSISAAGLVAEHLFKTEKARETFVRLVELSTSRNPHSKDLAYKKLQNLNPKDPALKLGLDQFRVISDWYHFAILDLSTIPRVRLTPKSVATLLGLSEIESKLAIERLVALGLLIHRDGKLRKARQTVEVGDGKANEALRSFHRQMIQKALLSIHEQTLKERHLSARTMAIKKSALGTLEVMISDFMEKLTRFVEKERDPDSLYQINIQLFRLTKKEIKEAPL